MTTEEGNKLIMFFCGAEDSEIDILGKVCPAIKYKDSYYPPDVLPAFHKDWNLLMPVVEKIRQTSKHGHLITISFYSKQIGNPTECRIYMNDIGLSEIVTETPSPIESVYQAVVQFIEWYNQSKNTQS
jgi:hypothetical protein